MQTRKNLVGQYFGILPKTEMNRQYVQKPSRIQNLSFYSPRGLPTVQELIFRSLVYRVPVSQAHVVALATGIHTTTIHKGSHTVAAHPALLKLDSTPGFCHRSDKRSVTPLLFPLRINSYFCSFLQKHPRCLCLLWSFPFLCSSSFSPFPPLPPLLFYSFSFFSLPPCFFLLIHECLLQSMNISFLHLHTFSLHSHIVWLWPQCPSPSGKGKCSFQPLHSLSRSRKELRGWGSPVKPQV